MNLAEEMPSPRGRRTLLRRAIDSGGAALTDRELLRLSLGAGRRADLLSLALAEPLELVESGVLSDRAAARLVAALELVRRLSTARERTPHLPTPTAVWSWVLPKLAGLRRETFRVLCLDPRRNLLREVVACEGSADSCRVDPREIFAPALCCRASAIVLVHNHPSGDPEPSLHDVQLTLQLKQAGELLCVRVLDHLVVTPSGFVSMLQRQLLEFGPAEPRPRLQ